MSQMANEAVHLSILVNLAFESVESLYCTIKGIPNLSSLFAELQTQLQAMKTVLRLLDKVPDAAALDTNVTSLVGKFGTSCVSVRESIERLWQSGNPDWTTFQDGTEDTAAIVRKLRLYMASIVIGGLQDLNSKGHIALSAQDWEEYQKLIADARIAHRDHLNDLVRRVEALEERSRSS